MKKLLSLIIPTNGITEWVTQVVESIYSQNVDDSLFEVVITDNGECDDCKNAIERNFSTHSNLVYKKTNAKLFLNQIEAFKISSGLFIKFVNHRSVMDFGSIDFLINYVEAHENDACKPITFFMNPTKQCKGEKHFYDFDSFVRSLGYWSSWSGGLSCWKEDFERLSKDLDFNSLFPHTTILFYFTDRTDYIINYKSLYHDIPANHSKKGKYKLYYAFSVEYPSIMLSLLRNNNISIETFDYVKKQNEAFVVECYENFSILHNAHSYDLSGAKDYLNVFYSYKKIRNKAWRMLPLNILYKMFNKLLKLFRNSNGIS